MEIDPQGRVLKTDPNGMVQYTIARWKIAADAPPVTDPSAAFLMMLIKWFLALFGIFI